MNGRAPAVRLSQDRLRSFLHEFVRTPGSMRPETIATYQRSLREFQRWQAKDGRFRFRVDDVQRYRRHLTSGKKLSQPSVSTYLTSLRRFCAFLVQKGILRFNPATAVRGGRRPTARVHRSLSAPEVARLLTAMSGEAERERRDRAIAHMMTVCGLSETEIVAANIGDVVEVATPPVLRAGGTRVTLAEPAYRSLQEYLALRPGAGGAEPLFASAGNRTRGMRMTTRGVRGRISFHLRAAGLARGTTGTTSARSLRNAARRKTMTSPDPYHAV